MARQSQYTVRRKSVVFSKGPIHLIDCEIHMMNGKRLSRQILDHPGSVVIIPRLATTRYLLIRQFRFATGDWIWEFPAGGIEKGESLRGAARRELVEETGLYPQRLISLVNFYPSPGISSERMYLFLAESLRPAHAKGDEDEAIEKHSFSTSEIVRMIRRRKIVDAKTIAGFLYLEYFLKKEGRKKD